MRLAELQALAGTMGLKGISRMRKSELIAAIRDGGVAEPDAPPARASRRSASDAGSPGSPGSTPRSSAKSARTVTEPSIGGI